MTDTPAAAQHSWICPECTRRVPNRLSECRCGYVRDEGGTGAPGALGAPSATGLAQVAAPSRVAWLVLGLVTVIAAGMLIGLQVIPVNRQPQASLASRASHGSVGASAPDAPLAPAAPSAPDAPLAPGASVAPGAPVAPGVPAAPGAPVTALEDVVSRSIPAIVSIETSEGRGSGFFAAPRTIITNRHVIQNNVSVTVRLSSGQALPGRVELSSSEFDLAIVRVDSAPAQAVLPLGSANDVRPGQEVIAIGLALGVFQNSVTRGIISAVRRTDRTVMLQTDAAINPGNSGGPLLNRQGEVVGINTLKISGNAESLGFAVAIDHARGMLAGGRPSETPLGTSAAVSQPLAPAFAGRSTVDTAREHGTQRYDQVVTVVARRAAQLDGYWARIKANCTVRVAQGYDREWFGLWDGRTALTNPDIPCSSAVRDLQELAAEVRAAMATAQEEARRDSVLPGRLRDIRRRYRMDWPGWE